jgi:hypothetical protein
VSDAGPELAREGREERAGQEPEVTAARSVAKQAEGPGDRRLGALGEALTWPVVPFHPGAKRGSLCPALSEHLHDLCWQYRGVASGEEAQELLLECGGWRLAQDHHMPDLVDLDPVDREVVGIVGRI